LAINFHYGRKNREALMEKERERQAAEQVEAEREKGTEGKPRSVDSKDPSPGSVEPGSVEPGSAEPGSAEPGSELVAQEETFTLRTSDVILTFTTLGGGIKHAAMSGQYAVQDKENLVALNQEGDHPIGRLTTGVDEYLDIPYADVKELDTPWSITFVGKTSSGL